MKNILKNKKNLTIFCVLIVVLAIAIAYLVYLKKPSNQNTEQEEIQERDLLSHVQIDDCIKLFDSLNAPTYEDIATSEYIDTLYLYHETEEEEFYLVCHTDIKYINEDGTSKDLHTALQDNSISLEELNKELEKRGMNQYQVIHEKNKQEEKNDEKTNEIESETEEKEKPTSNKNSTSSKNDKQTSSQQNTQNKNSSSSNSSTQSSNNSNNNATQSSGSNNSASTATTKPSSKEEDTKTLREQMAAAGQHWDFSTKAEAEAEYKKWVNRGFTAGYWQYVYGESDIAYEVYVKIIGRNHTCGITSDIIVPWRTLSPSLYDEVLYLRSLGYDCTGYCTRSGECY